MEIDKKKVSCNSYNDKLTTRGLCKTRGFVQDQSLSKCETGVPKAFGMRIFPTDRDENAEIGQNNGFEKPSTNYLQSIFLSSQYPGSGIRYPASESAIHPISWQTLKPSNSQLFEPH